MFWGCYYGNNKKTKNKFGLQFLFWTPCPDWLITCGVSEKCFFTKSFLYIICQNKCPLSTKNSCYGRDRARLPYWSSLPPCSGHPHCLPDPAVRVADPRGGGSGACSAHPPRTEEHPEATVRDADQSHPSVRPAWPTAAHPTDQSASPTETDTADL